MSLREIRQAKGLGLNQAARQAGVEPANLSKWETGKIRPGIRSLERLADFYGVTLDQLTGRAPIPASPIAS